MYVHMDSNAQYLGYVSFLLSQRVHELKNTSKEDAVPKVKNISSLLGSQRKKRNSKRNFFQRNDHAHACLAQGTQEKKIACSCRNRARDVSFPIRACKFYMSKKLNHVLSPI